MTRPHDIVFQSPLSLNSTYICVGVEISTGHRHDGTKYGVGPLDFLAEGLDWPPTFSNYCPLSVE